ncbi:hypothetical protein [Schlesneria paludicola]|uniref:hypothetical protein n=1 Tax=Schlesneria paludicola TaxID=360056 RepID=UPI0004926D6F|nr:hypothetical protein [Schlesneria paludicola]
MRSPKESHKIVVAGVEYRWRATGNDGWISVGIWPSNKLGPIIEGIFRYHETWIDIGGGHCRSSGDQIIVTNRIVRRIIEHAITTCSYNPLVAGKQLHLGPLEDVVKWSDAVRTCRTT